MYTMDDLCASVLEREPEPPELAQLSKQVHEYLEMELTPSVFRDLEPLWLQCVAAYQAQGFSLGFRTAAMLLCKSL